MELSSKDVLILKKAANKYRAINHKLRQEIIKFVDGAEQNVTAIYVHFRIEQSVASQQLKILRDAELVTARRDGKIMYYSANVTEIERVINISKQLTEE